MASRRYEISLRLLNNISRESAANGFKFKFKFSSFTLIQNVLRKREIRASLHVTIRRKAFRFATTTAQLFNGRRFHLQN